MGRRPLRLCLIAFVASCNHGPPDVTVGAAISLKEAFDEIPSSRGVHVKLVYGASGDLASQMLHGAPLDVLALAGEEPSLAGVADESCTLAWNTLVLVSHRGSLPVSWDTLGGTPPSFRLAIGLTPQVPAGVYAEQALRALGEWDAVLPKVVRGSNVRNVLDLVVRGEADAGIVYATDVYVTKSVDVVSEVPRSARPNVRYPLYVSRTASPEGRAVAKLLCDAKTKRTLAAHGFLDHPP
jgi:molybdate transport system substrate-binding protein